MNDEQKKYCDMQREYYEAQSEDMQRFNHGGHELNPDYACTLLQDCHVEPKWKNTKVFEFGCGCGRNILWLREHADWCQEISGCDISANNIANTRSNVDAETFVPGSPAPTWIEPPAPPYTNLLYHLAWIVGQPHQTITTWFFQQSYCNIFVCIQYGTVS